MWIEIGGNGNPSVRPIPTPATVPVLSPGFVHEDISTGGIYTSAELTSWKEHLQFGDLHEAITKTITMGICNGQGTCTSQPSTPNYNLENLLNPENLEKEMDPFAYITNLVQVYGSWMALLVLVIEGLKAIIFLTSLVTTFIQEGAQGFKALVYIICCGPLHEKDRITRRGRQIRRRLPSGSAERFSDQALTDGMNIPLTTVKGNN